jgi:ABC-2 type transport system ATP-binding protein
LGLDFESKAIVREMLRKLEKPVLFTSHDALDIENVCSRVIVLRRGEVVFDGSINTLKRRIRKRIVKVQTRNPVDIKIPYLRKLTDYVFEGTVSSQKSLEKLLDMFLPYDISDLEVRYPSMEEVFMDVFKD